MSEGRGPGQRFSLSRWSRRKLGAAQPVPAAMPPATASPQAPAAVAAELPPVESLTFASDFTAFLRPGVDDKIKRAALKQLFRDPRFNVMDGLDTYIDDYTQADPIAPDVLADLLQRFGGAPEASDATEGAQATAPAGSVPAPPPAAPDNSVAGSGQDAPVPRDAEGADDGAPAGKPGAPRS